MVIYIDERVAEHFNRVAVTRSECAVKMVAWVLTQDKRRGFFTAETREQLIEMTEAVDEVAADFKSLDLQDRWEFNNGSVVRGSLLSSRSICGLSFQALWFDGVVDESNWVLFEGLAGSFGYGRGGERPKVLDEYIFRSQKYVLFS